MRTERDFENQLAYARKEGIQIGEAKGREEGIAEGEAKGREEALQEVAKTLLASGMSAEQVQQVTGLVITDAPAERGSSRLP